MTNKQFSPVDPQVNFPELEKKLLQWWYESGIISKYLTKNNSSTKRFSFIDGPITANNPMGVHHAWGRSFKDLWQKYHNMKGEAQRFQNGFDCQGLWVEVEVEKELGIRNKQDIENLIPGDKKASIDMFVNLCKDRVKKYSAIQTEQSKRLGYFMDWDHSYFTMSDENNYMIWHFLKVCHEKEWIYKSNDVVAWCPRCETAISQHEMLTEDYKELVHQSIFLELPLVGRERENLLIWTTTPWTLPANTAVAVNPELMYALVTGYTGDKYWVMVDLVAPVFKNEKYRIEKKVLGKELVGLKYTSPFDDLPIIAQALKHNPNSMHIVIATDDLIMPISTTEGTGLVHTSTSTGEEDFRLGKKLKLPIIPAINDRAEYLTGFGILEGKNAKKHPELIFDILKQKESFGENWIFNIVPYKHRYPACWRCKTELVWKIADEWYIAMDKIPNSKQQIPNTKDNKTLREQMIEVAKQIHWMPEFGLERELDWLKNMHDWLISKPNRYWGLALPIYECTKCGYFEVLGSKQELQEKAIEGWEKFAGNTPHKPWIDEVKIKCSQCGEMVERLPDVGNVWLDAGIIAYSTLIDPQTHQISYLSDKKYWQKWFPADFITESFSGQFKNWFYAMIAMSTVLEKTTPFKTVLGYGTLLGEDGRPMHKSWGNSIEFNESADKIGVDVMRWMFANHDPSQNILFGYNKADEVRRRFLLILWNVYNFFITYARIDNWESTDFQKKSESILDQWILSRLNNTLNVVTENLDKFEIFPAATSIEKFISDLSLWYVRRSRDRIGPTASDLADKHQCYRTLYTVLVTLSQMIAPIMPFMSEEMYKNLTGEESVHLSKWPELDKSLININLENDMQIIREIVENVHSQRKAAGIKVRQPLQKIELIIGQNLSPDLINLIKSENNVKNVIIQTGAKLVIKLDTQITPELKLEGEARDLIRKIQVLRKEQACNLSEKVIVTLPSQYQQMSTDLLEYIKNEALISQILWGEKLTISPG